jgi:hypothetical protein
MCQGFAMVVRLTGMITLRVPAAPDS